MTVTRPRVGVLALQGDVREHVHALTASGADATPIRRPAELAAIDGIVIPGGESTTMSKLLGIFDLFDPLQQALNDGLPAYGSCAGMIMLATTILDTRPDARHLDALDITVRRNAFGRQVESFETDLDFIGITDAPGADPMRAVFIRAPWVEAVSPDVQVLATVPAGPAQGRIVAVRQGNILATSFHPEVTGDRRVHEYFVSMVRR
ncbi:pyridoxal 5'-phosphate synthase glutaminase subunit PdxT [Gordonia sp. ABSL1-1]|uniref:pyridoxal 5'-phosphate synthase glutaminase subunit PdxT n=1 Tax=Gordonia sp. ABSL1-1 TaxID=3053923 RepID=UPI0025729FE6|nr:pyridoxal 5'-phosphate synthase glutaminase subunit PdxT [Gordonia sp. ABSL1-1]MDL9936431.1 pyridoxal 5'-phosphate synthase glutaminase subunit PdxT [Gordonia sp. ABSL1-1]